MFKFGDYVLYNNGYKKEVGRVTKVDEQRGVAWVCYHEGCTAACTSLDILTPYNGPVNPKLGYHRFDDHCPDYDPDCCFGCKARNLL